MTDLSPRDITASGGLDVDHDEVIVPRSIGRLLDVFETVVERESCTLSEVADAVGLTPTTARRYLQALGVRGYVRRDLDGAYRTGPTIDTIVDRAGREDEVAALARRVQNHLDRLAASAGESAYLGVVDGDDIVYVATAQSERAIRHVGWIGQRLPFTATAIGAALSSPGAPVFRSGGLEADIAAVSCSLPGAWAGRAAVSIVGPTHRFDEGSIPVFRDRLITTIAAMADDLRLEDTP